jgi:transmembrane sensor
MPSPTRAAKLPELMQQAIEWLVLLRSGEISDAETHAFADWLSQDIAHAQTFAKAEDLLNDAAIAAQCPRVIATAIDDTGKSNPNLQVLPAVNPTKANRPYSFKPNFRWLALPVSLAAAWLFAIFLIVPEQSHWFDDTLSDYHTRTGELQNIRLADGSQIILNTNTAISVDYSGSFRRITLHHGQAQFTVATEPDRPFEVESDGLAIRALGTIFEVYHPGSGEIRITVQEHAVTARFQDEVNNFQQIPVEIKAGQGLRYHYKGRLPTAEPVNLTQASAWQQQKLFINDRPLAELVAELDRYRTGRIFIADPSLKNLRITCAFSLARPDETLAKVRKALALQETRLGAWWVLLHR